MASDPQASSDEACGPCVAELAHCHATLVLHADGALDCPELEACGAQPDVHLWWISCTELASPCGCTGDEHPGVGRLEGGLVARAA